MRTLILGVTAALALAAAPAARADDASRQAVAHEVVALMHFDQVVGDMFQQLSPMMASAMGQQMHLNATEQARLGEILAEELRASTPQLLDSVSEVYAHQLTEPQLVEVRTFLRTPAGVAFMGNQASVQQELQHAGESIGAQVAARAIVRFNDERRVGAAH